MTIEALLEAARKRKGITQEELVARANERMQALDLKLGRQFEQQLVTEEMLNRTIGYGGR